MPRRGLFSGRVGVGAGTGPARPSARTARGDHAAVEVGLGGQRPEPGGGVQRGRPHQPWPGPVNVHHAPRPPRAIRSLPAGGRPRVTSSRITPRRGRPLAAPDILPSQSGQEHHHRVRFGHRPRGDPGHGVDPDRRGDRSQVRSCPNPGHTRWARSRVTTPGPVSNPVDAGATRSAGLRRAPPAPAGPARPAGTSSPATTARKPHVRTGPVRNLQHRRVHRHLPDQRPSRHHPGRQVIHSHLGDQRRNTRSG